MHHRFNRHPRASAWIASAWCACALLGCNVEPDVVARAVDAGVGLNEDDGGQDPLCQIGPGFEPVDCEVPVPAIPGFSPTLFNVNVMQGGELIPYGGGLTSIDACADVIHGWYWVDLEEYTRIGFCPQTCALIDQWQQLFFEFGCNTRPAWLPPPRP